MTAQSVQNVYLIFSANKSGEYFGYARMASPINEEAAADLEWTPATRAEAASAAADPDLPRSIPTPATATAPRGHIIDDSARGTIFWEAEHDDDNGRDDFQKDTSSPPDGRPTSPIAADPSLTPRQPASDGAASPLAAAASSPQPQTFGTPFRVEWLATQRLPFHRTRGLRNPWNANREVKIARDGTELETGVGRRLVALFHHRAGGAASPAGPSPGHGPPPPFAGSGGVPGMPPQQGVPGFGAPPPQMQRPF